MAVLPDKYTLHFSEVTGRWISPSEFLSSVVILFRFFFGLNSRTHSIGLLIWLILSLNIFSPKSCCHLVKKKISLRRVMKRYSQNNAFVYASDIGIKMGLWFSNRLLGV
jgi:hypothetical protein